MQGFAGENFGFGITGAYAGHHPAASFTVYGIDRRQSISLVNDR